MWDKDWKNMLAEPSCTILWMTLGLCISDSGEKYIKMLTKFCYGNGEWWFQLATIYRKILKTNLAFLFLFLGKPVKILFNEYQSAKLFTC